LDFVEKTKGAPLLHLSNSEFGQVILKYDESHSNVEFKFPEIGLYNYRHNVIMVRRAYARQFKKGICNSTIEITSLYRVINSCFALAGEERWNEELAQIITTPCPTLSLKEGLDALNQNLAIALSQEFAIGHSTKDLDGRIRILWYFENPIGTVDPSSGRIFLREKQFSQEFQDFIAQIRNISDYTIHS